MMRREEHIKQFQRRVRTFFRLHRRDFPWRRTGDPYRILVSEVMLQQTQTVRVVAKYREFIRKFPTVRALARAQLTDVLRAWSGLGYNRRARALWEAARVIVVDYRGKIPNDRNALDALPGVGHYTAAAVRAFAFNEPDTFIETNIRSVFIHEFFPGRTAVADRELVPYLERSLDRRNPREWYYALMDYGAMLKRRDRTLTGRSRHYSKQKPFAASSRQLRGRIVKILLAGAASESAIASRLHEQRAAVRMRIEELCADGLVVRTGRLVSLP
jgi:A/G-specific adenine glycosylase